MGGAHVSDLGVCSAATQLTLDGANRGRASGRACWVVVGTFCKGIIQGSFAEKLRTCTECEFQQKVAREEYPHFVYTTELDLIDAQTFHDGIVQCRYRRQADA